MERTKSCRVSTYTIEASATRNICLKLEILSRCAAAGTGCGNASGYAGGHIFRVEACGIDRLCSAAQRLYEIHILVGKDAWLMIMILFAVGICNFDCRPDERNDSWLELALVAPRRNHSLHPYHSHQRW